MRKLLILLTAFLVFLMPLQAEEPTEPETDTETETEEPEEPVEEYAVDLQGNYAVLIDADSGKVLFEKNSDVTADPASLTKIMSVYLAAKSLSPEKELTMSSGAFQSYDHSQGVLWIQQGEELSAEECEYASMLASANDTCAMLAEGVSGSLDAFVSAMNAEASSLGMEHTQFDNCFGYHSDTNYSTAADMALLVRQAMKNDVFREIFAASSYTISGTNMQAGKRVVAADCELIKDGTYSYADAVGGKIGSTYAGGYSLAACAKRGATTLIAVVLGEKTADAAYHDAVRIFEYGFENAQTVTITPEDVGVRTVEVKDGSKKIADVTFTSGSSFSVLMPREIDAAGLESEIVVYNEDSTDPEEITAEVIFTLNGEQIGSSPMERTILRAPEEVPITKKINARQLFDYICIAVLAVIVLFPLIIGFFTSLEPPK